jgi:hypothetical protein
MIEIDWSREELVEHMAQSGLHALVREEIGSDRAGGQLTQPELVDVVVQGKLLLGADHAALDRHLRPPASWHELTKTQRRREIETWRKEWLLPVIRQVIESDHAGRQLTSEELAGVVLVLTRRR